ncbi:hypothetical protein DFJ58DRAFT_667470 [Suillus subalutaceus]|uniref:uncharacterized protein n=1 Tax=Suillus subalutaceus TaxID=48586 RepID=UPI001B87698F|nr:uncharacterized protein DFJ58DRAFT_667470 [Suillus subalutaceus]KAG1839900.1 hypothetical protein DFJ58DRAFT_667470 [Suillus subalutaceus]
MQTISSEGAGWHFGASSATTKQLEDFSIKEMAGEMETSAPALWNLLGGLLGEDRKLPLIIHEKGDQDAPNSMSSMQMSDDDSYWDQVEVIDLEGFINGLTSSTAPKADRHELRSAAIISIVKKVVILSILMQSTNRKSNTLQSILGIFLQSMHTPQHVVDTLA